MKCVCGHIITPAQKRSHERGKWHLFFKQMLFYRERGLSFAEIGREVGLSRARVASLFREVER